jgi:hypothetical protein
MYTRKKLQHTCGFLPQEEKHDVRETGHDWLDFVKKSNNAIM